MSANINIYDVAKLAGVSISTVSRVLNNRGRVKEETEKKVMAAITELGFHPNMIARGLAMQTTGIVGALLPSLNDFNYPDSYTLEFLNGVQQALSKRGYNLLMINDNSYNESSTVPEYVKLINGKKIDGFVAFSGKINSKLIKGINSDFPVVVVGNKLKNLNTSSVLLDYRKYIEQAIDQLYNNGHRRIAVIHYDNDTRAVKDKNSMLKEILKQKGMTAIENENIINGSEYKESIYERLKGILKAQKYTAYFVDSVYYARRLEDAASDLGLKIPEDISVICYEYTWNEASRLRKPISSVYISSYRAGEACVELLFGLINSTGESRDILIEGLFKDNGSIKTIE